jgi:5'-3' exonuclease
MMRTALIDGDSIAYILGWNFRESYDTELMQYSVDNFVQSLLTVLETTHYIGALSSKPVFRDQVYCYAKYKGTRKEDEPWITRWKPIVNARLTEKWKFVTLPMLEADDVVGWHAYNDALGERIVCSPDKDLRQIPGTLYDYRTGEKHTFDQEAAKANFTTLMVCGDTTDNIKGVPGLGPVKLKEKLKRGLSAFDMYIEYFGNHYGTIIYEETLATVQVLQPGHSHEAFFEHRLNAVKPIAADNQPSFLGGLAESFD